MLLHDGMTLHPGLVCVCFILFGLFCARVMVNMFKQGKKGLGSFMVLCTLILLFSAYLSAQVSS